MTESSAMKFTMNLLQSTCGVIAAAAACLSGASGALADESGVSFWVPAPTQALRQSS